MDLIALNAAFVLLCAFLYRLGGGPILGIKKGWKPARRYILPIAIAIKTGAIIPMIVFSAITHFNLQEIEERRWEEVFCYGMSQAWCFLFAGLASGFVGAWWIVGVYLSNIGIALFKDRARFKIDWFWVELIQGCIIGLICV